MSTIITGLAAPVCSLATTTTTNLQCCPQARRPTAMPKQNAKQQQLNKDYADFLIDHEAAKAQGEALGTFLEWRHKNDRDGVKIVERKK